MKEKIKWTKEKTRSLILIKHGNFFQESFKSQKNNPNMLSKLWIEIAKEIGLEGYSKEVKTKYNALLNIFRKIKGEQKVSGSGTVNWLYFQLFNDTYPDKLEIVPENYCEIGTEIKNDIQQKEMVMEDNYDLNFETDENLINAPTKMQNFSPKIKKEKGKNLQDLKIKVFEGLAKKFERECDDNNEMVVMKEEIVRIEKDMNNKIDDLKMSVDEMKQSVNDLIKHLIKKQ